MNKRQQGKPYIRIIGIAAWLASVSKRKYTPMVCAGGKCFYKVGGKLVPKKKFEKDNPIVQPVKNINLFGDRLDSRQID